MRNDAEPQDRVPQCENSDYAQQPAAIHQANDHSDRSSTEPNERKSPRDNSIDACDAALNRHGTSDPVMGELYNQF